MKRDEPSVVAKSMNHSLKALLSAAAAIALSLFANDSFAEDGQITAPGGGVIKYFGAESATIVPGSNDVLLKFLGEGSYELPGMTKARILAIGGGGGGGGTYNGNIGFTGDYGGGAGGGAGGFVETNGYFDAATYTVSVGAGGAGGKKGSSTSTNYVGGDGGDTVISVGEEPVVTAYGGGAGGGQGPGNPGGSGGGGSMKKTGAVVNPGGANVPEAVGQGFAGGSGDKGTFGGGGGGAGGAGAAASTKNPVGGVGRQSDITCAAGTAQADWPWYAGGGGGGWADKAITSTKVPAGFEDGVAGGKGGGGNGGVGRSTGINPGDGEAGTGGGGGGCNANTGTTGGGDGGCGVVYVRISGSLAGGLAKPEDHSLEFDGAPHKVVEDDANPFYTIDGQNEVTAMGVHSVQVTPISGVEWEGGGSEAITVTLTITEEGAFSGTAYVTGAPVEFAGVTGTNWINGELILKFTSAGTFKLPGTSQARILAIGGGGGGGGTYNANVGFTGNYGGGGGGGAGGFVETNDLFGAALYTVNVGAGGAGSKKGSSTSTNYVGEDGGNTSITADGAAFITAYGGGGGGGQGPGNPGGSGGGGSMKNSGAVVNPGGTPVDPAQGFAGGSGDKGTFGGGGGGAGGAGAAASTKNPVGGVGRQSDITCAAGTAQADWPWYAGGGGGGWADKAITSTKVPAGFEDGVAGGKGGGGNGGVGRSTGINPGDGEAGTGGGGGGCNANTGTAGGGNGGSGIVYVRIASAMEGDFERPQTEYAYTYDATEHFSVKPNVFYDVVGENAGTTAGVYVATAKLHAGVTWPDGGKDDVAVTMTISRLPVTVTALTQEGWTFGDVTTPDPVSAWTTDPAESHDLVTLVFEYRSKTAGEGEDWSAAKPTQAGDYLVRARSVETKNFDCAERTAEFTVAKLGVTFTDFLMRDWMEGLPPEETPEPSAVATSATGAAVEPLFEYGLKGACNEDGLPGELGDDLAAGQWSQVKPTEAGKYVVRVRAPDFDNYVFTMLYADFSIIKGLANLFTDYVKITIAGGAEGTKVPYVLTLSEAQPAVVGASPYGFLYERAGVDGEAMAVSDMDGNALPYQVLEWNEGGASRICVRLPAMSAAPQSIYLYWHLREGKKAPEHAYAPAEVPTSQPACTYDLVSRDNRRVNFWVQLPQLDKDEWASDDPQPGRLVKLAKLAEGVTATNVVNAFAPEELVGHTLPTTAVGAYRAIFLPDDPRGVYEPLDCHLDFRITGVIEIDQLGGLTGDATANGRVLLANDDEAAGHAITDQGYWQTNVVDGVAYRTFWDHGTTTHRAPPGSSWPYLLFGVDHMLKHVDDIGMTNVIWRFKDVIFGNQFGRTTSGPVFAGTRAYLPWSATSHGISTKEEGAQKISSLAEVGNVILRDRLDAAVYSPCYPDGIGTIYFDVVNGETAGGADSYKIVVEVATATDEGLAPTDENSRAKVGDSVFPNLELIETNWVKRVMFPLVRDNNVANFSVAGSTKELALGVKKMGTTNNFYRVYVPVNVHGPARFRIRRTTVASYGDVQPTEDRGGFILLDNIQVSYPQMTARMEPMGLFEKDRTGRQVLGWAASMETPFPAVGAKDVYARAQPVRVTSGLTNVSEKTLITQARLHYRWRYLDQRSNDWDVVALEPANGFVSDVPLKLPNVEGDIEFWLENDTQIPYYRYYDYAATGLGLGASGYDEAVGSVTNSLKIARVRQSGEDTASPLAGSGSDTASPLGVDLPSGGEDWFFRMRNGRSDYERIVLDVREGAGGAIKTQSVDFDLVGNRIWRAFLQTPSNAVGSVKFRLRALNRQDPTSPVYREHYMLNTTCWKLTTASIPVGSSGIGSLTVTDEDEPVESWSELRLDAKSGYVMIQIDDNALSLTAVHGEKQDFNLWTDAHKTDGQGLFVGQSRPGEPGSSGSSDQTQKFMASFTNWTASVAVDPNFWREAFNVDTSLIGPGKPYELNRRFGSATTPNGWESGPGMWATSSYGDPASGLALQMEGQGAGFLQFTDGAHMPRGLKSIRFTARLAQFIGFDTFAYWDETEVKKTEMANYTFIAKGAFDTQSSTAFAGAASLSVLAYYRPKVGAYEFRLTQKTATMKGTAPSGPGLTRTLQLFRWSVDPGSGQLVAEQLGTDFDVAWTMDENASWLTGSDASGAFFPQLFISCSNATDKASTVIRAGVSRKGQMPATSTAIESACLTYTDNAPSHLTAGTFGLGSASCPARFCGLLWYDKPVRGIAAPAAGKMTQTAKVTPIWNGTQHLCGDAVRNYEWAMPADRFEYAEKESSTVALRGFRARIIPQKIEVYTAPASTGKWGDTPINTFDVASFGASGLSATNTITLYATGDAMVKIKMTGSSVDPRCDVVIDDVELEQWRGESYDTAGRASEFDQVEYGSPTNFVPTTAWVNGDEDHSVKLSARRTTPDQAASLRAPLMDGLEGRGIGLGFMSFAWRNAQTNACLLVQVATNETSKTALNTMSKSVSEAYWSTVTNLDFSAMDPADRREGKLTVYLGLHGQKGVMRLVVDPKLVERVKNVMDETAFGEVDIVSITCSDEPQIDERCWWGWNVRTTDETPRIWLGDEPTSVDPAGGMAFGLNNSVSEDVRREYGQAYNEHLPFLQTPALTDQLIGEISFRARRYEKAGTDKPGERTFVTLYGSNSPQLPDRQWAPVTSWEVTNDVYETFTYRAQQGIRYAVLRLAVTGVKSVKDEGYMPKSKPTEVDWQPLRVLIDEVSIFESVEARVAFRNVRAFRYHLEDTLAVEDIMDKAEQPLCRESFGVQGEIYAAQLGDEVDLSRSKVRLWWYPRPSPWGFANWRTSPEAKSAWLAESSDTKGVFRSSYLSCPAAVIEPAQNRTTMQYMLEVIWKSAKDGTENTNWLERADWVNPEWYAPVDMNDRSDGAFCAYTLLDTVAPGWAWINELNLFGEFVNGWNNSDKPLQFLEVAAPGDADLSGWKIRFINAQANDNLIVTNDAALFGRELPGLKVGQKGLDPDSKYVFHVLASPHAIGVLDASLGQVDGYWLTEDYPESKAITSTGELRSYEPVSVQLVRPSGIIESEITGIGTNFYWTTPARNPVAHTDYLNAHEPGGHWIYVGADDTGSDMGAEHGWSHSLGVFADTGAAPMQWNAGKTMTPGEKNKGQVVPSDWPRPLGSSIVIYSFLEGGHLWQQLGDAEPTNQTLTLVFRKGDENGTNITYRADPWYWIGAVTNNGVDVTSKVMPSGEREWTLNVAKGVSNDVTVVAAAGIDPRLELQYGIPPDDRYRQAIVDWLAAGVNMAGQRWHDPTATELGLADFVGVDDTVVTNLNLREMYWLDMDPTWPTGTMRLKGYIEPPLPQADRPRAGYTNVVTKVFMMITNRESNQAWAPYVLRGSDSSFTSWQYAKDGPHEREWGDECFKMTGILVNGPREEGDFSRKNWLPLRNFVFDGEPGVGDAPPRSKSFGADFKSEIEVRDPYKKDGTPAYAAGWYDWVQEHGWCPVFWSWDLDDRTRMQSIEVLKPVNRYE